jgi:methylenetetrahydrofolate dehydrogenase (NADP+)/methenyltetrahydrofolate cyclohydrolase
MILDGKLVANEIGNTLKEEILARPDVRPPHLVIISVGDDPASKVYVKNKVKKAEELGIYAEHIAFSDDMEDFVIANAIRGCNGNPEIDGIMLQLPLPAGYNERGFLDLINPAKDVDGLTTTNIGKLRSGQPCIKPCTAAGVMDLLDYYHIPVEGKDVTIVGRSNIVGKPLADLMMAAGATVAQCHSKTTDLLLYTMNADIVISAIGKPKFFTDICFVPKMDAIIDVGINRDENGKLCGDVDFDSVKDLTDAITPVPGGVGPMTVIELMKNTVECWKKNI